MRPGGHATSFWTPRPKPRNGPFIDTALVSVTRGTEVAKARSLMQLCYLRFTMETYTASKDPLQSKCSRRFQNSRRNCGYGPRCVPVVRLTYEVSAQPRKNIVSTAAAGLTTPQTTEGTGSNEKPRRAPLCMQWREPELRRRTVSSIQMGSFCQGHYRSPTIPTPLVVAQAPKEAQAARTKKPAPKVPEAAKKALVKQNASTTQFVAKTISTKELVAPRPPTKPIPPQRSKISSTPSHGRLCRADTSATHSRPLPLFGSS
jgi:hypothetical protein